MAGWIAFVLAFGLSITVLMKIPIDTQYFTIVNSVLIAYVAGPRSRKTDTDDNDTLPVDSTTKVTTTTTKP